MTSAASTFADVEKFVALLQAACKDASMNETLRNLLSQPDESRKAILHKLIDHMRDNRAPEDFVDSFVCLLDNDAAEKAYQVLYKCPRRII